MSSILCGIQCGTKDTGNFIWLRASHSLWGLTPPTCNSTQMRFNALIAQPVRHRYPLLDFGSLRELPDSHAWPELHDHPSTVADGAQDPVPSIDLNDPDVLGRLARAGETWGLFQVTGHDVPVGLLDDDVSWYGPVGDGLLESSSVLQLNSYPACPDPDQAVGLAAHTDSSLFTSGLQVLRPGDSASGRWVTVPPTPGALVVNEGDLFQTMSNGRYPSVGHRAVVNRLQHRFSVVYVYAQPAHVAVARMRGLLGPGVKGAFYGAVTWPEFLSIEGRLLLDGALASVMISAGGETCRWTLRLRWNQGGHQRRSHWSS